MTESDDQEVALPDLPTRSEVTFTGLKPISPDLEPDVLRFVTELRRIFGQLGMSLGQYARIHYRDKSVLSRYLSGNRIPPRELLDELISDIMKMRGIPLTAEADGHLRQLHLAALASRDGRAHQIQVLTDQLENSVTELWQSQRRIEELEGELSRRESALSDLTGGTRQLQRAWDGERERTDEELAAAHERYTQLREEHDRLHSEAAELRVKLAYAQEREARAQERCVQLEQALEALAPGQDSDADDTPAPYSQHRNRRAAGNAYDTVFYLSYAGSGSAPSGQAMERSDRMATRFFTDLSENVGQLISLRAGSDAGFIDTGNLSSDELLHAMGTCQVLVALLSAPYLRSEWCGQEWSAFSQRTVRVLAERNASPQQGCIIPVLWAPLPYDLPSPVAETLIFSPTSTPDPSLPDHYRENGVFGLMLLGLEDSYQATVWQLAMHISRAVESQRTEHRKFRLEDLRNAFWHSSDD